MDVVTDLGTGIGTSEKNSWALASKSGGLARVAKLAQTTDVILKKSFLGEASINRGQQSGNNSNLGVHDGDMGGSILCIGYVLSKDKRRRSKREAKTDRAVVWKIIRS